LPLCLDKVLITGGAGFIGSHLVDRMLQEGFEVIVVDDLSTGKWKNIEHHESNANFHFVKQSILNFKSIKRIVADVDAVLHQAAIASVTESMEDPFSTNLTNVTGTLNLLKASIDTHVKRFVFASSSSVYGDSKSPSQHEAMPVAPMSPYAASKTCGEAYCQVYHRIYGLNTTSLRYFNVYGPRQSYGPYSGVITIFIDRILKGQPPIIFGTGKQSRDFIHVTDVAEANLLAMRSKNATGEIINIGSGKSATINELAKMLLEITGRNYLKPRHTSPRLGDVKDSCADTRKAKRILGFSPRTRLREGLARLIESLSRGR
jgi:UDP-glucose 4-epimerase